MTEPKKSRARKAPTKPEPATVVPNPLSPRRLELTKRLHDLAGNPDAQQEFERVRADLDALPPGA